MAPSKTMRSVCIVETIVYTRCISVDIEADTVEGAIEQAKFRHGMGEFNDKFDAAINDYEECIGSQYEIECQWVQQTTE